MKFNAYLVRKQLRRLRKKFHEHWRRMKSSTPFENSRKFSQTHYARLVTRGEYTKRDLAVLFIVAFSFGMLFKMTAAPFITMGFDDYRLPPKETLLNLNAVQKKVIASGGGFMDGSGTKGSACLQ